MRNLLMMTALLLAIGCATSDDATSAKNEATSANEPEVTLVQLSHVAAGTEYDAGPVSAHFRVDVRNPAATPIHLDRVSVQSIGGGAYDLPAYSQAFDVTIEPKESRSVDFWARAYVANPTVSGANGPVTIRATLELDAAGAKFQKIVMQNISSATGH
jgi:hypothetical protein